MINKISKYKWRILISSLIIVLPSIVALVLKNAVQERMLGAWHFTWIFPIALLLAHVFCILFCFLDNGRVEQSEKIVNLTFWILPAVSVVVSTIFTALSLGAEFNIGMVVFSIVGVGFIIMGNYLPKAVRNRTFGVKIRWTLANDANWAATHRFCAKLWVGCGIATIAIGFVPMEISVLLLLLVILVSIVPPIVYSYVFYRHQIASGAASEEDYSSYPKSKDKKTLIISLITGGVILVSVGILMFVGSIAFTLGAEALEIKTSFGGGTTLDYSAVESVEYVEDGVDGMRVSGFASARLLFGWFKNDELGDYSRYTYTGEGPAIIIRTADGILVISDESPELTARLYEGLIERIK